MKLGFVEIYKRCALLLMLTAIILVLVNFGYADAKSPRRITIAHWGSERILIYLPLYVALDGGFFRREGLNVELKYSGNDDQVFATVASGAALFGVGDPAFTAISREQGGKGRLIASLVSALTNWGVTKDSKIPIIDNLQKLSGLRVTSFPEPSTTFSILMDLKAKNHLSGMTIVPTIFGSELVKLINNDADIAVLLEPQTSLALKQGYRLVWSVAEFYKPFLLTGISTTDDIINKEPTIVYAFVRGIQRALEYIRANPDGTTIILQKSFPTVPLDVISDSVKRMIHDGAIPNNCRVELDAWRKTLEIRINANQLKSMQTGLEALDNRFADEAVVPRLNEQPVDSGGYIQGQKADGWEWFSRITNLISFINLVIILFVGYFWYQRNRRLRLNIPPHQKPVVRYICEILENSTGYMIEENKLIGDIGRKDASITRPQISEIINALIRLGFMRRKKKSLIAAIDSTNRNLKLRNVVDR